MNDPLGDRASVNYETRLIDGVVKFSCYALLSLGR